MQPLYTLAFVTAAVLAVVPLSFLGPEYSGRKYRITVQRIRAVLHRGSCVICAITGVWILLAVIAAIHSILFR